MTTDDSLDLAERGAAVIDGAFGDYWQAFATITRRAAQHFDRRAWGECQQDAQDRLDQHGRHVDRTIAAIGPLYGTRLSDRDLWLQTKACHVRRLTNRCCAELAATFYNSVVRRVFDATAVDPRIEYADSDWPLLLQAPCAPVFERFPRQTTVAQLLRDILTAQPFATPYADLERDVALLAQQIEGQRRHFFGVMPIDSAELLRAVFYRHKGAYLVGNLRSGARRAPLFIALLNTPAGIVADAILLSQDEAGNAFSLTHSYFHADIECPRDVVEFLQQIMPWKTSAQLYTALGRNKHGKTEQYRSLRQHLIRSRDLFERAPGERGMVMIVFTLATLDIVFKVIRDHFPQPKSTSRQQVMSKYRLVFHHDRAGRLVDVQEYEHLVLDRQRFSPELLAELLQEAGNTVHLRQDEVILDHVYVQRRVTPLDLYLRYADDMAAREAILDYGLAIRDLAASNIFPGDLLLKNFGVDRLGRVVFYDYDELCLLTDCHFRDLPTAPDDEESWSGEPWFYVGEHDVFPEEFLSFLGLPEPLASEFLAAHADLLSAAYYNRILERLRAGEILDVFPYAPARRLSAGVV